MEMIFDDDDDNEEGDDEDFSFPKNETNGNNATSGGENNDNQSSGPSGDNSEQVRSHDNGSSFGSAITNAEARSIVASLSLVGNGSGGDGSTVHSWDAEAAEKGVRQTMILEIARLLKSRKKTQPSNDWLQQLPHKARKLEERLYRAAPSLSAYQDLSTLKNRLQLVAQIITNQYATAKTRHSFVLGGSRRMSALSSLRGSFASSTQEQRHSIHSPENSASLLHQQPMAGLSAFMAVASSSGDSAGANNEGGRISTGGKSDGQSSDSSDVHKTVEASAAANRASNAGPIISNNSQAIGPITSLQYQQQQQQPQQQPPNTLGSDTTPAAANAGGGNLNSLEQQKALNERLRLQIQENIRRQNEWLRQMQQAQQQAPQAQANGTASVTSSNGTEGEQQQQQQQQQQNLQPNNVQQNAGANNLQLQMAQQAGISSSAPATGSNAPSPFGAMANMTKHMAAMGMAAGIQQQQQQQQGPSMLQTGGLSGGLSGFPFPNSAASAALLNNPATAARIQALLMQQQQQHGMQNTMNMLSSQAQQQQQNPFLQQQLQQRLALGLQHQSQLSQQIGGPGGAPNTSITTNNSGGNTMQGQQQQHYGSSSSSASSGGPNSNSNIVSQPNNIGGGLGTMPSHLGSNSTAKDGDGSIAGATTAPQPSQSTLSPGSFHWG
ncbi:hypothetical protein ACA910_015075 [Epithemia clementina (nom. ined.)]